MVIADDIQAYKNTVTGRGFLYYIGLFIVIVLSIFKFIVMICHDIQHMNNKLALPMTTLFEKQYEDHVSGYDRFAVMLSVRSNIDKGAKSTENTSELHNIVKSKALSELRNYFLTSEILEGDIIKTRFPKVAYEDVYNSYKYGAECKACLVQHISFGKDMNMLIHKAFNYPLKRKKLTGETFLVFNDGETYDLERTLQETFYCDTIRLKLRDTEPQKPKKVKL